MQQFKRAGVLPEVGASGTDNEQTKRLTPPSKPRRLGIYKVTRSPPLPFPKWEKNICLITLFWYTYPGKVAGKWVQYCVRERRGRTIFTDLHSKLHSTEPPASRVPSVPVASASASSFRRTNPIHAADHGPRTTGADRINSPSSNRIPSKLRSMFRRLMGWAAGECGSLLIITKLFV